ncbi:DAO domain-containing protein [Fusarium falciforme]|uniref:DAO domain-containing protein n=1 Tax=Fusarium falciforme TaxID=195108 RepID=UPI00230015F8|nr:DAO domain-containing protein [Fusarium falciforme]WAO92483.1 DAO domain-containing protein [Fusarium falciforme]
MSLLSMDKTSPIAIVGGGAWGLSTALHLVESGYTNITVFERDERIPSQYSAAYDLNKIIRAEYEDPFYTELTFDAIKGWKTPLFGPYYHETGYINCVSGKAPEKAVATLNKNRSSVEAHPGLRDGVKSLSSPDEFRKYAWQLTGPLEGFKGYFNKTAGYGHSGNALKAVYNHCATKGVRFILGEQAGKVTSLSYDGSGRCTGLETADGRKHSAALTICALGANGASLVPSLGKFTVARSWSVAHVQLTQEECDLLRGIPVTNVRDLGFFFEPDPATKLFKLCPLGAGFTNTKNGLSLPPANPSSGPLQDFIPYEDEQKLRQLLRETIPWMADRPFVDRKLCWFNDSTDSEYLVDFVPGTEKTLVMLSGDSGHGFKMMPIFGKWVLDLVNNGKQKLQRWQWKDSEQAGWGNEVSWRVGTAKELHELEEESKRILKARL